jgi:hypothetical protein
MDMNIWALDQSDFHRVHYVSIVVEIERLWIPFESSLLHCYPIGKGVLSCLSVSMKSMPSRSSENGWGRPWHSILKKSIKKSLRSQFICCLTIFSQSFVEQNSSKLSIMIFSFSWPKCYPRTQVWSPVLTRTTFCEPLWSKSDSSCCCHVLTSTLFSSIPQWRLNTSFTFPLHSEGSFTRRDSASSSAWNSFETTPNQSFRDVQHECKICCLSIGRISSRSQCTHLPTYNHCSLLCCSIDLPLRIRLFEILIHIFSNSISSSPTIIFFTRLLSYTNRHFSILTFLVIFGFVLHLQKWSYPILWITLFPF